MNRKAARYISKCNYFLQNGSFEFLTSIWSRQNQLSSSSTISNGAGCCIVPSHRSSTFHNSNGNWWLIKVSRRSCFEIVERIFSASSGRENDQYEEHIPGANVRQIFSRVLSFSLSTHKFRCIIEWRRKEFRNWYVFSLFDIFLKRIDPILANWLLVLCLDQVE